MRSLAGIALRDGRVFVARRKPGGDMGLKWEFPGGKAEPGEDDQRTLAREWDEEFGTAARALRPLGASGFEHGGRRYELAAWLIELDGEPSELREHVEAAWVGRDRLESLDLADSDRSLLPFVLPLLR